MAMLVESRSMHYHSDTGQYKITAANHAMSAVKSSSAQKYMLLQEHKKNLVSMLCYPDTGQYKATSVILAMPIDKSASAAAQKCMLCHRSCSEELCGLTAPTRLSFVL